MTSRDPFLELLRATHLRGCRVLPVTITATTGGKATISPPGGGSLTIPCLAGANPIVGRTGIAIAQDGAMWLLGTLTPATGE